MLAENQNKYECLTISAPHHVVIVSKHILHAPEDAAQNLLMEHRPTHPIGWTAQILEHLT